MPDDDRCDMFALYLGLGGSIVLIYVAACVALRKGRRGPSGYCMLMGLLAAFTYAVNMWYAVVANHGSIYNGFNSDNTFQVAYVNNVLHGNYLGDFYDKVAPSHYPPLYFWVVGTVGRLIGADAISVSVAAPFIVLAFAPILVFWIGRRLGGERVGFYSAVAFIALGNAMVSYVLDAPRSFPPVTWGIYKPYELLAGVLAVLWTVQSARHLRVSRPSPSILLVDGALGGALLLLYYPWFVIAAATLLPVVLLEGRTTNGATLPRLARFLAVVGIGVLVAAPSWLPYAFTAITTGSDPNYAWQYTTLSFFDVSIVTVGLGYVGALFFIGGYGLYAARKTTASLVLMVMLAILYVWFLSAFITYPLLGTAFLSWKGRILIFVVLVFATGFGLEYLRGRWDLSRRLLSSPFLVSMAILPLLPTAFQWNPVTDQGIRAALQPIPSEVNEIVLRLGGADVNLTVISSTRVATYLPAVSQLRLFTSHTIHFSNPLADFSERRAQIEALQGLSSDELGSAVARLAVDALILDKLPDGRLGLLLPQSAEPTSVFDGDWPFSYGQVYFARQQFKPEHFLNVYEDEELVVFRVVPPTGTAGT